MGELDEKKYWEDLFQLGRYLQENSEGIEKFKLGIQTYSRFLGDVDGSYLYNDTFLPLFIEKFLCIVKSFYKKYPFITELMPVCEGKKGVELIIDQYWKIEGRNQGNKCFVLERSSCDLVCQKKLEVKAVVLAETRRFIFQSSIELIDDSDKDKNELCKLKQELEKFVKTYMEKSEYGENGCTE